MPTKLTEEQLQVRFSALLDRIKEIHDRCKKEEKESTIDTLVDSFLCFQNLASAFVNDCREYLEDTSSPGPEFMFTILEINRALACSAGHLQVAQHRLGTTVLDDLAKNSSARENQNYLPS